MGKLEEIREYLWFLGSRQPTETESVAYRHLAYLLRRLEAETRRREAAEAMLQCICDEGETGYSHHSNYSEVFRHAAQLAKLGLERAKEEHDAAIQ